MDVRVGPEGRLSAKDRYFQTVLLLKTLFFFFTLFYFTILYWFCHTSTWVHHGCTWVPNPEPPSHLPHHTISLGHPSAPAPSILYPVSNIDWHQWKILKTLHQTFRLVTENTYQFAKSPFKRKGLIETISRLLKDVKSVKRIIPVTTSQLSQIYSLQEDILEGTRR